MIHATVVEAARRSGVKRLLYLDSSCIYPRQAGRSSVAIWGSGSPRFKLLHVDDLADACLHLMRVYAADEHVNVGTGEDISIRELAEIVRDVVAPGMRLDLDLSKPDGMPRKLLDVSKLHRRGWRHRIELRDGIETTYRWFLAQGGQARGVAAVRSERSAVARDVAARPS